jgi:hypothetical protein
MVRLVRGVNVTRIAIVVIASMIAVSTMGCTPQREAAPVTRVVTARTSAPIVTKSEYDQIDTGISYRRAVAIIGENGEEISKSTMSAVAGVMDELVTVMYQWVNADGSNMNAMFQNDALMSKAQFGLK